MKYSLEIDGTACLGLALLLLTLPLKWLAAALLAAGFHEFCHLACLRLTGEKIHRLRIGVRGAKIETGLLTPLQELLCALSGPAGSLMLFFLFPVFPALALCGLVQGICNLIPIYPQDGGRALRSLVLLFSDEAAADAASSIVGSICSILIVVFCIFLCFVQRWGIFPLFLALTVLHRGFSGKISCKESFQRVQ